MLIGAGLLLIGGTELVHWRASRRHLGRPARRDGVAPGVVLVLGHPSRRSGRLHPMQRWRTDIAVRSMRSATDRLVFSGAGRGDGPSEAEVMATYARRTLGVPADAIVLETRAATTWQNVAYSLGELEQARTIAIASSPLHAARARRYLAQQRPDLADRLTPADDHRFGERWLLKVATVGHALGAAVVRRVAPSRRTAMS